MLFSSLVFLFGFLPVFLLLYYATPVGQRNITALLGSLLFYTWGEPVFVVWLVAFSIADYAISRRLARLPAGAARRRWWLLATAVGYNLAALVYFKYSNFFVAQTNGLLGWLGHDVIAWKNVALPLGISFFTFHRISYLVDVYRGTAQPARSATDHILFITLFPQLVAGPIIRYHDIAAQLACRDYTLDRFLSGVWRFTLGLGRKVLIANPIGDVADRVFAADPAGLTTPHAWVGVVCYTLQIYFDFAAYSDMAVGLGRMLGFDFLENFIHPYTARSITDFWRRWHRSLSRFMLEYLYIPLGGNRAGPLRRSFNLWAVFLLSGFWHGASWSFVVWGAFHGAFLSLEKIVGEERLKRVPAVLAWAVTMLLVMIAWVFFRADTLPHALACLRAMFGLGAVAGSPDLPAAWIDLFSHRALAATLIAIVASVLPEAWWDRLGWTQAVPQSRRGAAGRVVVGAACLLLACGALANQSYNPFIYFRF